MQHVYRLKGSYMVMPLVFEGRRFLVCKPNPPGMAPPPEMDMLRKEHGWVREEPGIYTRAIVDDQRHEHRILDLKAEYEQGPAARRRVCRSCNHRSTSIVCERCGAGMPAD